VLCERWGTVGPPTSPYGGRRQTTLVLRWLKTVVGSEQGKGAHEVSGGDQEDVPENVLPSEERSGACVAKASKHLEMASKPGGFFVSRD